MLLFLLACLSVAAPLPHALHQESKVHADPVVEHIAREVAKANVNKEDPEWRLGLPMPELAKFDPKKSYIWELDTSEGRIDVVLLPKVAPRHVTCTLYLSALGYYDNLKFHRVIRGFMAQGGCPLGTGMGNPGFQYAKEIDPNVRHDRAGVLSMANSGPGTEGSQFFLTFNANLALDGGYTIFGHIESGASMRVVNELERYGAPRDPGKPSKELTIKKTSFRVEDLKEREPAKLPHSSAADDPALKVIDDWTQEQGFDKTKKDWKQHLALPPKLEFTPGKSYFWNMDTSQGTIKVKLFPASAPQHCSSAIFLSRIGFYDDQIFHRIIPGFMAQGGCPLGKGHGGPGYKYAGEIDPKLKHDRPGLLSTANLGTPNTDGSQFFLTFAPAKHLDGGYTIFGEVVEGLDTIKEIEPWGNVDRRANGKARRKIHLYRTTISVE